MLFYITHNGTEHQVRVESRHNQLYVTFDNEPEEAVDLTFIGNDCFYLQKNRVFHANVVGNKGNFTVWRPEGSMSLTVESEYRRIVGTLRGRDLQHENNVYAKMPGKIAKISVKKGDMISQGDPVLVMEAMKMENEIRSPSSGIVANILVSEGQAVESGALLVELTDDSE